MLLGQDTVTSMGLRRLNSCLPRDSFLFPDEQDSTDGCDLLPRAWWPTLMRAQYSEESISAMFATCDGINTGKPDGGLTWRELRDCFEADGGDSPRWMIRELHRCYDQIYTDIATFDEKLDESEFEALVAHQSSLWDAAHDGDACAAAFLAHDKNRDLLLQYGES